MYGQMHGERAIEALITESVIFTLLSERGLGPRLHGVFPGGRIEEYIAARPLKTKELSIPSLSAQIATKMAAIHKMEVGLRLGRAIISLCVFNVSPCSRDEFSRVCAANRWH